MTDEVDQAQDRAISIWSMEYFSVIHSPTSSFSPERATEVLKQLIEQKQISVNFLHRQRWIQPPKRIVGTAPENWIWSSDFNIFQSIENSWNSCFLFILLTSI